MRIREWAGPAAGFLTYALMIGAVVYLVVSSDVDAGAGGQNTRVVNLIAAGDLDVVGEATAATPAAGDSSTRLATTAFVTEALAAQTRIADYRVASSETTVLSVGNRDQGGVHVPGPWVEVVQVDDVAVGSSLRSEIWARYGYRDREDEAFSGAECGVQLLRDSVSVVARLNEDADGGYRYIGWSETRSAAGTVNYSLEIRARRENQMCRSFPGTAYIQVRSVVIP